MLAQCDFFAILRAQFKTTLSHLPQGESNACQEKG